MIKVLRFESSFLGKFLVENFSDLFFINQVEKAYTLTSDWSNKLGIWGHNPQVPEANGGLGGPNAAAVFYMFFSKK